MIKSHTALTPLEFAGMNACHADGGIRVRIEIGECEERYLFFGRRSVVRLLYALVNDGALPGCIKKVGGSNTQFEVDLNQVPLK